MSLFVDSEIKGDKMKKKRTCKMCVQMGEYICQHKKRGISTKRVCKHFVSNGASE